MNVLECAIQKVVVLVPRTWLPQLMLLRDVGTEHTREHLHSHRQTSPDPDFFENLLRIRNLEVFQIAPESHRSPQNRPRIRKDLVSQIGTQSKDHMTDVMTLKELSNGTGWIITAEWLGDAPSELFQSFPKRLLRILREIGCPLLATDERYFCLFLHSMKPLAPTQGGSRERTRGIGSRRNTHTPCTEQ
ncbi:MAG: hypothetical protein CV089_04200 [Nitrospira sp. WS110]|nr:hypothetical protein [Nitrospira sp. WS110]